MLVRLERGDVKSLTNKKLVKHRVSKYNIPALSIRKENI
ncbi:hypothetical protein GGR42_002680 [Saonia flava]|uniref:Uncharacterized protein n=1 Tax=Saonia flava TaxID=523696 RepID=A0A846R5Y3_9FLAO|nr:hypothetical protein [Saonia flava]